jgi:hypothetical protein
MERHARMNQPHSFPELADVARQQIAATVGGIDRKK